ncbi:MAG: lysophospholipid acyltransferase family protein [Planctomycetes bacterium]|nr:lysophospholipid acyltransferase family protein [Planctomycetota bacterium]
MRLSAALKSLRHRLEYLGALAFLGMARALPERMALWMGAGAGQILYYLMPNRRRVGLKNIALAFPEPKKGARRRILRRSVKNHGRMVVELARFLVLPDGEIIQRVGYTPGSMENYEKAAARGNGVMYITGHICNWELLALAHSLHGHPMRLVARRLDNPLLEALLSTFRTRGGNQVSERGKGGRRVRDLIGHLRAGGTAGILVDQYARGGNGIFVPFFGKLASSHRGPAMLALRTGAALLPAFLRRHPETPGHYLIHFCPEVALDPSGDSEKDILLLTTRLQKVLEQEIRSRPEDWFWLHCRWKNSPELPGFYGNLQKRWRRHRYQEAVH